MGEVWKARDTRFDRIVAIKTSKIEFSDRFEREARAVAALNHPNICQLYDVAKESGVDYLVMEYVSGKSLDKFIPSGGLPVRGNFLGPPDRSCTRRRPLQRHRAP